MIYTEITPNPDSLKFVVGQQLLPQGTADFPDVDSTEDAPLAKKLFGFEFVERVFFGNNFITITKQADFRLEDMIPVIKAFLKSYFASDQPIVEGKYMEVSEEIVEESEVVKKIKQLIDSHIRPAIAMDGGDVVFDSFDEGTVKLVLQGSCSGCPSSVMTLKQGIQGLLTRMVPEVQSVEAVNG